MITKKIVLTLVALVLCVPAIVYAAGGQPFNALQLEIDQQQQQLQNIGITTAIHGSSGGSGEWLSGVNWSTYNGYPIDYPASIDISGNYVYGMTVYIIALETMTDDTKVPSCVVSHRQSPTTILPPRYALVYSNSTLWLSDIQRWGLVVRVTQYKSPWVPEPTRAGFNFICVQE